MMTSNDPWANIKVPSASTQIIARRNPEPKTDAWGLYWGVDAQHRCLLMLQRNSRDGSPRRLPQLRGLSVETLPTEDGLGERVVIRLNDGEQRGLFHRFCVDVVEATQVAGSDSEAVERFLTRTWRWHRLLRSGRDDRLSDDEQKGLIGELRVVERLLRIVGAGDAVESWGGPLGSPKDFQVGLVGIEAKAHSPQKSEVSISSLHQLDHGSATRLFLSVSEIGASSASAEGAVTVTQVAARVRSAIDRLDSSATILFEDHLSAVGFDWDDDYTDRCWLVGDEALYEVVDGFPRVTPSMVSPAVQDVHYNIRLAACEDFRVSAVTISGAISGETDGP